MENQLLIEKPIKLICNTINITVKNCIFNENGRPVKLTTTKDTEYIFPKMVSTNRMILEQLKNFLCIKNKITIIHDNADRIHKLENIILNWNESDKYKLMIISLTKGLLFDDYVEVNAYENINKFYKNYGYVKFFNQGLEITIIIKDILSIDIPIKY